MNGCDVSARYARDVARLSHPAWRYDHRMRPLPLAVTNSTSGHPLGRTPLRPHSLAFVGVMTAPPEPAPECGTCSVAAAPAVGILVGR